jgi:hypothetical protein
MIRRSSLVKTSAACDDCVMGDYFATTGLDFFFAGPLHRVSLITDSAGNKLEMSSSKG